MKWSKYELPNRFCDVDHAEVQWTERSNKLGKCWFCNSPGQLTRSRTEKERIRKLGQLMQRVQGTADNE